MPAAPLFALGDGDVLDYGYAKDTKKGVIMEFKKSEEKEVLGDKGYSVNGNILMLHGECVGTIHRNLVSVDFSIPCSDLLT